MSGEPTKEPMSDETDFSRLVAEKAALKLRTQREGSQDVWFGLGMLGIIGWSVAVPTLLGALLGHWWDRRNPGAHSWTLALLVGGLVIGCVNAWLWVAREENALRKNSEDRGE